MKPVALLLLCFPLFAGLRPPSIPLVAHDPYFSIWMNADAVNGDVTRHWTGAEQPLTGLVRIDGKAYRFLGGNTRGLNVPALKQDRLEVTPLRTTAWLSGEGVTLRLSFFTPALPADLDVLSRPVTYIEVEAASSDGRERAVQLYFDAAHHLAVNTPDQRAEASRLRVEGLETLRLGSAEPKVLGRSGDNLRIEWGHLYLAAPGQGTALTAGIVLNEGRSAWIRSGQMPASDEVEPAPVPARNPLKLALSWDLGRVGAAKVSRQWMIAYDDHYSIEYLQRKLRPWWRRNGMTATQLLATAWSEAATLAARGAKFDEEAMASYRKAGGEKYADIAALAFRQTLAAHKLVADLDGKPLYFSKENFSNGCIATVDVTYPSAPFMLVYSPELLKAMLRPVLDYSMLPRWRFPFAPHDLGQYPLANGQVYGGGELTEENQMPVEESGNMLILLYALAVRERSAEFARPYLPALEKWAAYLKEKGLDPENQLCTDDFAGHLAHNTNLSLKAIVALASFGRLAGMLGRKDLEGVYLPLSGQLAAKWPGMADDGGHSRLAFDRPGTWSQKYNLVWDKLLGFRLFPPALARQEVAYYLTKQNAYGLPLDNRETYTKLDWIIWSATMAEKREDFEALVAPVWKMLNESPSRVPMTDWYWTLDGKQRGFQARSVVGGVYIKLLAQ
jgi:hypothetical protein